jgi:putative glycerol-1-phosphate prenyltransferase
MSNQPHEGSITFSTAPETNPAEVFCPLIDLDKVDEAKTDSLIELAVKARVDYLFVGGSLVVSDHLDKVVQQIRSLCKIPIILFPGTPSQISPFADALLYLSLISGRNPELLIGQHVISAPAVRPSPRARRASRCS